MIGFAQRSSTQAAVAVLVLSGAVRVHAQGVDTEPSFTNGDIVGLVVIIAVLVCLILFLNRKWRTTWRKEKFPGVRESVSTVTPLVAARAELKSNENAAIAASRTDPVPAGPPAGAPRPPAVGTAAMPSHIAEVPPSRSLFISYRRQDSQHITGRIYDRLSTRFGKESVFKDVDSIPLGIDFRDHLREQVGRCAVLVAVIGKNWNPPSTAGQPRLSDPRDHLRIEIESALERGIPVIPVLVDQIEVPAEQELPPSLARLAYHNGIAVRPDPDFHHDMDRLVRGIEQLIK